MFDLIYRYHPGKPTGRPTPADADEACRLLEEGNLLFSSAAITAGDGFRIVPVDLEDIGISVAGGVLRHNPFAAVLGCADARAPTELIFDRACNELFVVRVAGNVLGQAPLGSIGYAVENFGDDLKAVVVLGHSGCGAVTAAVDAYVDPVRYLGLSSAHQLRGIVDAVIPAVRGAARSLAAAWGDGVDSAAGYRTALVEASVVVNAALVAHILAETFGTGASARRVVFGVYDLATRRVHVPTSPDPDCGPVVGLVDAPRTEQDFVKFVAQVTRSGHVKRLLA